MWVGITRSRKACLSSCCSGPGNSCGRWTPRRNWPRTPRRSEQEAKFHEEQALEARRYADQVFSGGAWVGESAEAAETAYRQAASAKFDQAEIARVAKGLLARASSDVERTKRKMTEESDAAHQEAEAFLRGGSGQSIAAVGAIVSKHRSGIQVQSADLHAHVANDTLLFTNKFPLKPGRRRSESQTSRGRGVDQRRISRQIRQLRVRQVPQPCSRVKWWRHKTGCIDTWAGRRAAGAGRASYRDIRRMLCRTRVTAR